MFISKNLISYGKAKYIKVKFYAIREVEREWKIKLIHWSRENQLANIFTKALTKIRFKMSRSKLGVLKKKFNE